MNTCLRLTHESCIVFKKNFNLEKKSSTYKFSEKKMFASRKKYIFSESPWSPPSNSISYIRFGYSKISVLMIRGKNFNPDLRYYISSARLISSFGGEEKFTYLVPYAIYGVGS